MATKFYLPKSFVSEGENGETTEPSMQAFKPLNTRELSIKALDFDFNPSIPLKFWVRTSDTLLREAFIYEQEGNDQQAYLLFMRYAALVTDKIPQHPSARDLEYRQAIKSINKTLPRVMDSMEYLKPRINSRYNAWERAESLAEVTSKEKHRVQTGKNKTASSSDPAIAGNISTLAAAINKDLAIRLARQEISRRSEEQKTKFLLDTPKEDRLGISGPKTSNKTEASFPKDIEGCDDDMRRYIQESRRIIDNSHNKLSDESNNFLAKPKSYRSSSNSDLKYPLVNKSQPISYQYGLQKNPKLTFQPPPVLPPKDLNHHMKSPQEFLPLPPQKISTESSSSIPPKTNPPKFTFRPSSYLENGKPLRTVFLPLGLRAEFLKYADSNTRKNLETCGMLCGTLISNALFIRRVVIPEQESTCDTCETTNEGAIFDYCDKEDLLVLGWIHTHPTQTCFMSSRDLHTHCGYQIMMPESIAIVCAPSKSPSWGVFRLTDPPGLTSILNCRHTGLFHPHIETNLYTEALRPGHVVEAEGMEFKVIDLRPVRL